MVIESSVMRLRTLRVGCFGGGTGLPSLLGGLRAVPWLDLNAIVTMFDSGGSSGQLRDELGVLPPGDILKCALALARNEREARRLLLSRLPSLDASLDRGLEPLSGHERLRGHTGGNLLLSMMAQYSGDFAAAVDGLQSLLGCVGRVWPISTASATVCAEYLDGHVIRGEVEVDENQLMGRPVHRVWLEPEVDIHPAAAKVIASFDAAIIGPGSFYTSLMPILLVRGAREAFASVKGPVVFVANLLSEGQGMNGMTAAGAASILEDAIGRPVDIIVFNTGRPTDEALRRYAEERKTPLELGDVPSGCEVVTGDFWRGDIARHDRRRLGTAVWAALAGRLLTET